MEKMLFLKIQRQDTHSFKKRTEISLGCLLAATGTVAARNSISKDISRNCSKWGGPVGGNLTLI